MPNSDQKLALVTGAGGVIGHLAARELAERGYRVRAAVHLEVPSDLPKEVEVASGDLCDAKFVEEIASGADLIFHFAAKLHVNNPSESLRKEYESVNVGATRSLVELSECERFIFASTINVYGTGGPFDETSEPQPEGMYAETKLEAERAVLGHPGGTVLRFAAVYGKGMKGNFPTLVSAIRKGLFAYVGPGTNRRTLIHETDAVRAAILAAEDDRARQKIYNVTDSEMHTLKEIVEAISSALGKSPPRLHLPESLARAAFSTADLLLRTARSGRRLTPLIEKINEDIAVSGDRIRDDLGFEAQFGLVSGWKDALDQPPER
jgi:UDP-glucose 4-epimerase